MIHCVAFVDVVAHLNAIGFREVGRVEFQLIFRGPRDELFTLREPNIAGYLPEILVNDAFDAARMEPPRWTVFFGD